MARFLLNIRELCILTVFLALGGAFVLGVFFGLSSWESVFQDLPESKMHRLHEVQFVGEYPVQDQTITDLKQGRRPLVPLIPIEVEAAGISQATKRPFQDQVKTGFENLQIPLPSSLKDQPYAFFIDIPKDDIKRFTNAYLYYYLVRDPHQIYVDGQLVRQVGEARGDLGAVQLLSQNPDKHTVRVLWLCQNQREHIIAGLFYKTGLTIRGEAELVETTEFNIYKTYFTQIVSSVSLIVIAILAFGFAFSTRGFLDIWAYAAFCLALGFFIWAQVPAFYWGWGWKDDGKTLAAVRNCIAAGVVILAAVLTMAYFRLEGRHLKLREIQTAYQQQGWIGVIQWFGSILNHPFRMTLISTVILCVVIVYRFWPQTYNGPGYGDQLAKQGLSYVLLGSQCLAIFFGYRSMFATRLAFQRQHLYAQVRLMSRRILTSLTFTAGMAIMVIAFLQGLGGINNALLQTESYLAAIFPAMAMLLMFFWMVAAANRFYQKFTPRLGQIDHEVLAFGEAALQKRYTGCLLVFDLMGMKKLNALRERSEQAELAVDKLLFHVEKMLSHLIQNRRITFKYKSNGDEFIFNMYAKSSQHAEELMIELTRAWHEQAASLVAAWRAQLSQDLRGELDPDALDELVQSLDLHVLITTLHQTKITLKGSIDHMTAHPDFIDSRFTSLTALFKPTRSHKIAMHADDAAAYLAAHPDAHFEPAEDEPHSDMGFLHLHRPQALDQAS